MPELEEKINKNGEGFIPLSLIVGIILIVAAISITVYSIVKSKARDQKQPVFTEATPTNIIKKENILYPRAAELFETCAKSYAAEGWETYKEILKVSDSDVETIFKGTEGLTTNNVKIDLKADEFEENLTKGIVGQREALFLGGTWGWGDITPICRNNLMDIDLRPAAYDRLCEENQDCCNLPEPTDTSSAKKLVEKFFECTGSQIKVDTRAAEKLKQGYFMGGGGAIMENAYLSYYLTDSGCLFTCYAPYTEIMSLKHNLIEKKEKEIRFEALPEESKTKITEFENKIESLYSKVVSEKNPEICEEIKREVKKVDNDSNKSGWQYEAMDRKSAYDYEDEYYEPCITIIAAKLNDESLCDKLSAPSYCKEEIFLQNTDLCKEIPVDIAAMEERFRKEGFGIPESIKAKEACIKKIALDTWDADLCKKINDEDCQKELANVFKNKDRGYAIRIPKNWYSTEFDKTEGFPEKACFLEGGTKCSTWEELLFYSIPEDPKKSAVSIPNDLIMFSPYKNWPDSCKVSLENPPDLASKFPFLVNGLYEWKSPKLVKTETEQIKDSNYYFEKFYYVPDKDVIGMDKNLLVARWCKDNVSKLGSMILYYNDESDKNFRFFNQMLSTFKFIE